MISFAVVISTILALMWLYVWRSLVLPLQANHLISDTAYYILFSGFLTAYFLQILRWLLFWIKDELVWVVTPAYFLMGLLSHLFLLALAKDVLFIFWKPQTENLTYMSLGIFLLCLVANVIGTHTALSGPEVKHVTIPASSKNPVGLKLVQISDLHVGPLIKKNYIKKVVQQINELKPDLVAVTGDLGDGTVEFLKDDLEELRHIQAPHGIYYVPGNHEYYWNINEWISETQRLGFQVLLNEQKSFQFKSYTISVGGIPDLQGARFMRSHAIDFEKTFSGVPQTNYKILLAHQPNALKALSNGLVDLSLSGHTHAGQFFPFNLIIGYFNLFDHNLNAHAGGWSYVNAGTGFWGPPLRLGVPSEITLIEWQ